MSNDNLQGMPPKPPVQPNQPPTPPTNPTASRLTPPVPPQQTAASSTTMSSQPPAPPSANAPHPGPQQQQPDSAAGQQPSYTTQPTASGDQNHNVQSNIDNSLANAKKFDIKDLIELKSSPEYSIGNFIGQTFCSFWRFDACSTRYDWWVGQIILFIFVPAVSNLSHVFSASAFSAAYDNGASISASKLVLGIIAIYCLACEVALTLRRYKEANVSPWTILLPAMWIPINIAAVVLFPLIGIMSAGILACIAEFIFVAVPVYIAAIYPPEKTSKYEQRYMVFHWEKLFG